MLNKNIITTVNSLSILDIADRLSLKYSSSGIWRKALCFCHDDHTPSLGINVSQNRWRCFSCGKGGGNIDLVMEHENLPFADACQWLIKEFGIPMSQHDNRQSVIQAIKPKIMNYNNDTLRYNSSNDGSSTAHEFLNSKLLETFRGTSNEFTRALVQNGILTKDQMLHAIDTFHLSTADDSVIFWQIDTDSNIREGKVMAYQADGHRSHSRKPVTISWLLKHEHQLPAKWKASPCLFGLHQLRCDASSVNSEQLTASNERLRCDNEMRIVAVVESEKTAVICSELIPEFSGHKVLWMATGGKSNLSLSALQTLRGYRVILFPDTDSDGRTFNEWLTIATSYNNALPKTDTAVYITVSDILERHASAEQKARKIDIADLIIESKNL